ncbi:MAG: PAS domain S-box protein [Prolixibacteraceae bacterium]
MSNFIILDQSTNHLANLKSVIEKIDNQGQIRHSIHLDSFFELITSEFPDIILINIEQENLPAFEVCRRLKSNPVFKNIPILLLASQEIQNDNEAEILNSDADGIVTFPINELVFKVQIKSLLKRYLPSVKEPNLQEDVERLKKNSNTFRSNAENTDNKKLHKDFPLENKSNQTVPIIKNGISDPEEKFKSFIQNSTEGIIIIDDQGLIIELNKCLEDITGLKKIDWLGMPVWDFQSKLAVTGKNKHSKNNLLKAYINQILTDQECEAFGKLIEKQIKRPDGQSRYIETNLYPIYNNGNFYLVSLIRDITQRKFFEDALKNSESKYHGIFHVNKDGISISFLNPDKKTTSNFIEANQAAYEMLGYTQEEYLSLHLDDIEINQTGNSIKQRIATISKNEHDIFETTLKHKDGHLLTVDINIIPIQYSHQQAVMIIVHDITNRKKVEAELSRSENLYRNLVERLPDGIYKSTHDGVFIEANPALLQMLGYESKEELFSIDLKKDLYFDPEDRESIALQEKYEEIGIFRLKKKDGSEIWVEDHGWYMLDDNGEIIFHEGIIRDISERKIAEEVLKESEERFKLLFEKAPIGYQSINESGVLIDINETWTEILGYSKNEVIGTNFSNYLTSEFQQIFHTRFKNIQSLNDVGLEVEMIKKGGEILTVQVESRVGRTPSGEFKQIHCVLSDITEKRKAEKEIADERILLRTLIDNIPDAIYVKDNSGRKLISNKADLEVLGLTSEMETIGKTDLETPYPGNARQTYEDDMFVIHNSQPIINKLEFFTDNKGQERYFYTSKFPLIDDSNKTIGLVGVGHEITRQRQSDQKIIQLSKGLEQSPASILITDTLGNIEYANQKTIDVTGYSFEEMKGKNPRLFQSGYTSKKEYEKLWDTINSGNEYRNEIQNRKKNGDLYWESVLIFPIRDENGRIINFMAIKEDITDRKKADLEIVKLSVAIEQNPASVVIADIQGNIEYVNKKFRSISGYTNEDLIGKTIRILKPGHTSEEEYIEIWNCLLSGNEWRGVHLNRTKDKNKYWESVLISPIKNQEGKITNYIILSEDISERKKMEEDLVSAKEKAEESDRLKSAFLANMSHEIRTPLNSILGFSDLLSDPTLDQISRKEFSTLINSSGNSLLSIINDVLDISKIEAGQIVLIKSEFSALSVIFEIQKEYSVKARSKGINLIHAGNKPENDIVIFSDEMRVKQILINFVGNALKFTEVGYIEIGVRLVNDSISFYVKDTGIGIEKEYHEKIFERFRQVEAAQTRKYGGNGLGLAITKNLAELLGGKIRLESGPGLGSTFFFELPASMLVK